MSDPEIFHNADASRFELAVERHLCVADYRLHAGVMTLDHTCVPPPLEGRGIAAALVAAALTHARTHGLRVQPVCSYVARYMRRHRDTHDLLEPGHG